MAEAGKAAARTEDKMDEEVVAGLDDIDETETIQLRSKEGELFEVNKKAAMMSKFVRTALENDASAKEVALFHIESEIVKKIIDYLHYHVKVAPKAIEKPLRSNNLKELVDDWDAGFTETNQDVMFKTLLAANYMDIKPLLMLMCAKVASLMKGKTPEEIRKTFNISDDYTPEDEEKVRKEYKDLLE